MICRVAIALALGAACSTPMSPSDPDGNPGFADGSAGFADADPASPWRLVWEDTFDGASGEAPNPNNWTAEIGGHGWGNGELQYYSEDNLEIAEIPGDPGNMALRITARQETGPEIVDQWGNPLNYTSGKAISKSKVSIKYGMIETRVRVPDLDLGGWPAVWLLGTANYNWPRRGEIDMMEMGSGQSFRDLHDEHNGGNGLDNSTVNQAVGANATPYVLVLVLVGLHGIHVLVGLARLAVLNKRSHTENADANGAAHLKQMCLFWHFLTVAWVVMFGVILWT